VKNNKKYSRYLNPLLIFSNVNTIIDGISLMPLDMQTSVIQSRQNIPADILKSYAEKFFCENEMSISSPDVHNRSTTIANHYELRALEKCFEKVKFPNKTYDTFFNIINPQNSSLLRLLKVPNVIPDTVLKRIMEEKRTAHLSKQKQSNDDVSPAYVAVCLLISLYGKQANLPQSVIEQLFKILDMIDVCETKEGYIEDARYLYKNTSRYTADIFFDLMKELKLESKSGAINYFQEISAGLKNLSKQINPNNILPHETAFADFIIEHISHMYDLSEIAQYRFNGCGNILTDKSVEQFDIIYKTFDLLFVNDWPNIDSEYDFIADVYADMCKELNREGQLFLNFLDLYQEKKDLFNKGDFANDKEKENDITV
jgi:hypothetical protein